MLTFRNMTIQDRDLVLPMVETFYQSDAVDHPVEREILERSFQAAVDPGEPLLRGILVYQGQEPAGYIYVTQCYSAEVGGQVRFYRGDIFSRPLPGTGVRQGDYGLAGAGIPRCPAFPPGGDPDQPGGYPVI